MSIGTDMNAQELLQRRSLTTGSTGLVSWRIRLSTLRRFWFLLGKINLSTAFLLQAFSGFAAISVAFQQWIRI